MPKPVKALRWIAVSDEGVRPDCLKCGDYLDGAWFSEDGIAGDPVAVEVITNYHDNNHTT